MFEHINQLGKDYDKSVVHVNAYVQTAYSLIRSQPNVGDEVLTSELAKIMDRELPSPITNGLLAIAVVRIAREISQ